MKKIEWNKVTWYSKLVTVVVFVITFWAGMRIGMEYQYAADEYRFALENMYPVVAAVHRCGGFIQNASSCQPNYHCVLGKIPDAGGVCERN